MIGRAHRYPVDRYMLSPPAAASSNAAAVAPQHSQANDTKRDNQSHLGRTLQEKGRYLTQVLGGWESLKLSPSLTTLFFCST